MKQLFSTIALFAAITTTCLAQEPSHGSQAPLPPQQFTDLPVDAATGKISFTAVITVDSTPAGKIRSRIRDWQAARNTLTSKNLEKLGDTKNKETFSKMDDRDGHPSLCIIYLTPLADTNKIVINVKLIKIRSNDMIHHPRYGGENSTFTVLIKDNKYKVTISDFIHLTDYSPVTVASASAGITAFGHHGSETPVSINYDNPDFKQQARGISQKEWLEIRQEGVNKMYQVLSEMVSYIAQKDDMNF